MLFGNNTVPSVTQVTNGTCKVTVLDAVTAAYLVANDFCDLDILDETFNVEHCKDFACAEAISPQSFRWPSLHTTSTILAESTLEFTD